MALVSGLVGLGTELLLLEHFEDWRQKIPLALLSLGLLVVVSSRAKTSQEANQLGGAVILPLIFVAASQVAPMLLAPPIVITGVGALVWIAAAVLVRFNGRRFTRDRLATAA